MVSKIFISYRRLDSAAAAGRLYDFLESKVGSKSLFKDVDTLPYGQDFQEEIQYAIDDSRIVLVVIGRYFITEEKRLFQENDYVRYEIDYALKQGKTVIPIRVDEARMPTSNELPEEIRKLSTIHGPELRHDRWKDDCRDFWEKIEPLFGKTTPQLFTTTKISTIPTNQFTDPRDGQVYKTVELVGKIWMADNLNFDVGTGCWFYDDNPKNGKIYGCLYTWEAAMKACPSGWRLPSDQEWKELAVYFGGYYNKVGKKKIGDPSKTYQALIESGHSRFNALLGGYRFKDGKYSSLGELGYYWSSTEYDGYGARHYYFRRSAQTFIRGRFYNDPLGLSCRCLRV